MSKWSDSVLEINDIYDYTYNNTDTFAIRFKDRNLFTYYTKCLGEYVVFRYVYVDCSCSAYVDKKRTYKIFKNCFITTATRESEDGYVVIFTFGEQLKEEEYESVLRGIKLNKLKKKIKST
jgi:hypothetical protein